ncbi:MAG: ATPase [Gammaproteobacteria bacterium]|nr:MAG: ATPase [Gammaproteobacteria bacterium]
MVMTYLTRNIESKINRLLTIFPVVMLIGSRQTGKTSLCQNIRPKWQYFDLENSSDFDLICEDFNFFFTEHPTHIIIDEAQESAELFRHLRGVIDANREQKGRFLLTGSSSPELLKNASDTLAGRIAIVEIGTLKMNEINQQPLPHFYQIFENDLTIDILTTLKTMSDPADDPIQLFLKGGYPEPLFYEDNFAYQAWMENYFKSYVNQDIRRLFPRLDITRFRRFISTLSSLSGTIINKAQLGRAINVSEVTIADYLDIADNTFIWRIIRSYESNKSKAVVKMPKGLIRDSGLNHYLLGIENREKLLRSPHVGHNFESFVIEEIIKGIQATELTHWDYHYFRTRNGAEIDLILEGNFGLLPIEIKFGQNTSLRQLTSLTQFIERHDLPLGIVINNCVEIKMLSNNIIQIPVGFL